MRLISALSALCLLVSAASHAAEPFLDQTKKIPATAEWSREVVTKKGGRVAFAIAGPLPVHVFVITTELRDAIAKDEKPENIKAHLFADKQFEAAPVNVEVNLPPGSYQVMIQNLSGSEAEYRLTATEVVDAGKKAGE